jgi:protein-L-isoaspartate(D-aspartate) O-methyltransferase
LLTDLATPTPIADELRARLVQALLAAGAITTPAVEAAFRVVPREAFAPAGTGLADAYADDVVITKRRPDGQAISSVSVPWLQATMLEQARLRPGARVLEVGSGGYHAALAAEVVGPRGQVTSVDIDGEVVDRARRALTAVGYPQVEVVVGDGEHGHEPNAPYDAIIITVEAADVPPALLQQLAPDGVLVLPLRIRGNTRSLALTRHGDHLAGDSAVLCGFVPMQGAGSIPERTFALHGDVVVLRIDDTTTRVDPDALAAALTGLRLEAWSPVTTPPGVSFESLLLWLASQPVPYGRLIVDRERAAGLIAPFAPVTPAFLTTDSVAYLALRRLDERTWQFGAHGLGPDADTLTARMLDAIAVWDRHLRHGPYPQYTVHPAGTEPASGGPADDDGRTRLAVHRRHTTIVITWPVTAAVVS